MPQVLSQILQNVFTTLSMTCLLSLHTVLLKQSRREHREKAENQEVGMQMPKMS
jgi:hypothetical protein